MAFYRGWLQGMPLREVADLYLETGVDLRLAKTTLQWVQDELRRAALRHGKHGEARLLRLRISDVRKVSDQAATLPSIDDFREEVDPTSFYTFDELMTQYLERYPQAGNARAKRRAALLQRQINTLIWLETLLVTAPVPGDPVEAWLDPNIVNRLHKGGIFTLAELIERISKRERWYKSVPQFGAKRAERLVKWLTMYEESLGELRPLTKCRALAKARPLVLVNGRAEDPNAPAIVPLDAMLLPHRAPSLPGFGAPQRECFINADNDKDAIQAWLNTLSGSTATRRAYRKEAERLVLWAMLERGQTLDQITIEDATSYRDFLCALGRVDDSAWKWVLPQEQWIAPRATKRASPEWRPFAGPLSPKSVTYALSVCNSMTRWLVRSGYLPFNPWDAIAMPRADNESAPDLELSRVFGPEQWKVLMEAVGLIEDEGARLRATLTLRLALITGMRLSELVNARYAHVYSMPLKDGSGTRWELKVCGKGSKWRGVPLLPDVMRLLRQSLRARGLPDDPGAAPVDARIITRMSGLPLSAAGLAWLMKRYNTLAVRYLQDRGRAGEVHVFRKASTHWIRHTTGARMGDAGVPPSQIQQILGHASIATTTIYTQTTKDEIYKSAVKTFQDADKPG